jgi:uncharacterized protein (DUF58 family)
MTAGSRLAGFAAAGLPLAVLDAGTGFGLAATLAYDAVLLLGAAVEARALRRSAPTVERRFDARLVLGIENRVVLRLHNPHDRKVRVVIRDDLPHGWTAEPGELAVELPPFARREVAYTVVPPRRGRFEFGDVHVRVEGAARLGASIVRIDAAEEAKVYPNVLGPRRYELAARLGDLRYVGFRSIRASGGGGEFEQLREYVRGDPYRDVDWKSTAKRQRPVTRVYQQERSQQVLLAIDAGRMMATRLGEITKLDHAINAALLLAYVALRQGDRVGLVVFSDIVKTFVPPGRGPGHYRKLLEALYGVEAEVTFVDFRRLVEFIRVRIPRRALLVMFSDLLDETHARPLVEHAAILRRKHLPVCVTMEDRVAVELAEAKATHPDHVYRRAAAADVLAEREAVKAHLAKSAVGLVEAPPGELAVATVNRYLEIKARRQL